MSGVIPLRRHMPSWCGQRQLNFYLFNSHLPKHVTNFKVSVHPCPALYAHPAPPLLVFNAFNLNFEKISALKHQAVPPGT
jgi:hypothetical protein